MNQLDVVESGLHTFANLRQDKKSELQFVKMCNIVHKVARECCIFERYILLNPSNSRCSHKLQMYS